MSKKMTQQDMIIEIRKSIDEIEETAHKDYQQMVDKYGGRWAEMFSDICGLREKVTNLEHCLKHPKPEEN